MRDDAWDRSCDIIAHLGSALTGEPQSRDRFHPFKEDNTIFNVDDPGYEYEKLMRAKEVGRGLIDHR